jgi:hypothetical protein
VENVGLRRAGLLPGILRPEDQIVKPLREARKAGVDFHFGVERDFGWRSGSPLR